MICLLDSSALVIHALGEPGSAKVQALIADESNDILISALSLFELAGILKRHGAVAEIPAYWTAYRECTEVVAVDGALAQAAWELRETIGQRLPIADAIIAATAQGRGATLVHRDQHLAAIPAERLAQLLLAKQ